jgi:polyisoprenoid-binding protein YceI
MMASLLLLIGSGAADAAPYRLSDDDGVIRFHLEASLHEIDGEAQNYTGQLDIGPGSQHTGDVQIPSSGLTTGLGVRDDRMHDFVLNTAKYPSISYSILGMSGDVATLDSGTGSGMLVLNGKLTIAGVSHDLDIPAAFTWTDGSVKLVGKVTTQWTLFNLPDPSILISTLKPPIDLKFAVTASKIP